MVPRSLLAAPTELALTICSPTDRSFPNRLWPPTTHQKCLAPLAAVRVLLRFEVQRRSERSVAARPKIRAGTTRNH